MRVLHVITRLIRGGAQKNTLTTALLHRRHGVAAELVYGETDPGREGELVGEARAAGLPLVHLPALVREPSPRRDLEAVLALARLLRERRYDVVHTHTSKAGAVGRVAARLVGAPAVVHTPHGHVFHSYYGPAATALFVTVERLGAELCDALVALTPRERDEHLALGIGSPGQFVVVPSGIDLERFRPRPGARAAARARLGVDAGALVVGAVGRLAPVKGHATLVRALPELARRVPRVELVLVGDGEEREPLLALARGLGVASRLRLAGSALDPEALLPAFDLAAVPSLNEGMGRVVLEAMAAGVPVVASAAGGIPDLVEDGSTGLLVPPAQPGALARALAGLALDPPRRARLAARARAAIGPAWGEEAMAERLLALYRRLVPGALT